MKINDILSLFIFYIIVNLFCNKNEIQKTKCIDFLIAVCFNYNMTDIIFSSIPPRSVVSHLSFFI